MPSQLAVATIVLSRNVRRIENSIQSFFLYCTYCVRAEAYQSLSLPADTFFFPRRFLSGLSRLLLISLCYQVLFAKKSWVYKISIREKEKKESMDDSVGMGMQFPCFLQSTPPSRNNMMTLQFDPSNMQYQPDVSASPPPPPPPRFVSLWNHCRISQLNQHPNPKNVSDDTTTSVTASGSRVMWENDDTDILVWCWAEVQRRYEAMPKTKLGKKKVLKQRGTELWREITEKVNVSVSVDRKPSSRIEDGENYRCVQRSQNEKLEKRH